MRRHRPQAGLTLIEVLIAMTLLSLLSLGLLFAMRIGFSAFAKTDDKLMHNRRVAGAQRVLEEELEGMMPVVAPCGAGGVQGPAPRAAFFQAEEQTMRLVSTFSLQQGWRGQPQILELLVIPGDQQGVRLVVNEIPYTGPAAAGRLCTGFAPDPTGGGSPVPRFLPAAPSERSFVLADKLAYCRFSYLVSSSSPKELTPVWLPHATRQGWPFAVRVEMAPLEPDPSVLQPITVTAPIHLWRAPEIEYVD